MSDDPTVCPTGCGRAKRKLQLLCPSCWRNVPRHLQRRVYAAWAEIDDGIDGAVDAHRVVALEAIAAAAAHLPAVPT